MDFINSTSDAADDQDGHVAFVPTVQIVRFRSRRPALLKQSDLAVHSVRRALGAPNLSVETLVDRTASNASRITPRAPETAPQPKFSIFKAVSAMRDHSGYRLRPVPVEGLQNRAQS